jgi:hypothetical protein
MIAHMISPIWREVIWLEAGYLSTKNQAKTMQLIKTLADASQKPEPFHYLVLAAECVRDVGATRLGGKCGNGFDRKTTTGAGKLRS